MQIIEELQEKVKLWNIGNETIEYFKENFNRYKEEYPEKFFKIFGDFNPKEFEYVFDKLELELLNHPEYDYVHIISYLKFYYKDQEVGEYLLYYSLDGDSVDDRFILY